MTFKTIGKTLGSAAVGSLLLAGAAFAQTDDTSGSTTVGTPNTGAGGNTAVNMLLMGSSAVAALAAFAYIARKRSV